MKYKINWDAFGIGTSIACAIHCAVLPFIMTSLPIFGINIIHNIVFEWSMIGLTFLVGCYSLYHGYNKHHRSFTPVIMFIIGCIFLVLKQVFHSYEPWLLTIAVGFIISAHYYNFRLCHQSKCSSPHHQH